MSRKPPLVVAIGLGVVLGLIALPLGGWAASVAAGAVGFYAVALIGSGCRPARTLAWGAVVIGLFLIGSLAPTYPVAAVGPGAKGVLFFAAVLSPGFRVWWFAQDPE